MYYNHRDKTLNLTTIDKTSLAADAGALSQAFSELIRVIQFRDRDRACCHGLTVSQCYGLKAVCEAGSMSVNELAGALYFEKSTASRLANGLEQAGLVERHRDPEDRRALQLIATAAGLEAYRAIETDLRNEYAALLEDFDPEVRSGVRKLVVSLTRVAASRVEAEGGSCCVVR